MKIVGSFLAVFIIVGCASIGVKREISPNNIFYSRLPNLKMKVGDDLQYKGTFELKKMKKSSSGKSYPSENEYHIWQDDGKSTLVVIFYKLPDNFFWYADIFKTWKKTALSISKETINGKTWQTRIG